MANIGSYLENAALNWCFGGAAVTQPSTRAIGLSLGSPTSISGSEMGTGSGYARQAATYGSAVGGTVTNAAAVTFGPFSSAASISGLQIWDTVLTNNSGNMLWYGLLATARTVGIGDSLVIASGALTISLS